MFLHHLAIPHLRKLDSFAWSVHLHHLMVFPFKQPPQVHADLVSTVTLIPPTDPVISPHVPHPLRLYPHQHPGHPHAHAVLLLRDNRFQRVPTELTVSSHHHLRGPQRRPVRALLLPHPNLQVRFALDRGDGRRMPLRLLVRLRPLISQQSHP